MMSLIQQKLLAHEALPKHIQKNRIKCNRTTRTTQNNQFQVVHNHSFANYLPRNQEKQTAEDVSLLTAKMRALTHRHIDNNCIFEHSKLRFDESSAV